MKITVPRNYLIPAAMGGSPDAFISELSTHAIVSGGSSTSTQTHTTFEVQGSLVPLQLALAVLAKDGVTISKTPYYAVIPDLDAALPDVLEPKAIAEYDDAEPPAQTGEHTETWREREKRWKLNLSEQEDGSGYWPLLVKDEALGLAAALDAGLAVVDSIPSSETPE